MFFPKKKVIIGVKIYYYIRKLQKGPAHTVLEMMLVLEYDSSKSLCQYHQVC